MSYQPIEDYGLIGNMRTAALVGLNGSIDWFCPDRFDAPSVFAKILDHEQGGSFKIAPTSEPLNTKQFYWSDTNVLVTRFHCEGGLLEIIDYMPVNIPEDAMRERWIIRRVTAIRGTLSVQLLCQPAFNYAQDNHSVEAHQHGVIFESEIGQRIGLAADITLDIDDGHIDTEFTVNEGETLVFAFQLIDNDEDLAAPLSVDDEQTFFNVTIDYWRKWLSQCTYKGRWREMVYRSALLMKLLTYEPTGAIVASPTTSLPEAIGGERNWDYRYTWLRDAAFTVYGFIRIGFTQEANDFANWIKDRLKEVTNGETLQIMYTIHGDSDIDEMTLDHLKGYADSSPVRIGNAAHEQLQLDIYGELMDALYLTNKYVEPVSYELWTQIIKMLDWVCEHWEKKDRGPWEVRGKDRHFVYSKVMLWVALDRGIRLSDKQSLPGPTDRWRETRDNIYLEVIENGWNDDVQSFTQYYGGTALDASNLIMPLVFFISPTDPMMLKTLTAIHRKPGDGGLVHDSLVFRYNTESGVDGLSGEEGTFNMCTFWLVEAMTRAGQVEKARQIFEQMLSYANHLGLFAEETGYHGEALGNYPQAFTHLSLISAAYNLDLALEDNS